MAGKNRHHANRAPAGKYGMKFRVFTVFMLLTRFRKAMGPAVGLQITLDADLGIPHP